ncbi:MAG: DNA repair protein RecN [Rhodoferax sp.]|jgi:DNA repair protein RecN (Recombination protein N)|nr:DNA repair protein RecN [Rhodoferax sp.]
MALRRIVLRDFVIVEELDLDLAEGFTVLTGETGAGKSILIDAVQLVTGARADASMVREGAARAEVTAEFDAPKGMQDWLDAGGFEPGELLFLRRMVDRQGKSRGWINGSPATATQMRAVGEQLLDIHGQHAWQTLTRPDSVRALLDAYAELDLTALSQRWQEWRQADKTLQEALAAQDSLQRERDRLTWQIGEVAALGPQAGEWDELQTDHGRLSHAQALMDAAQAATADLQDRDGSAVDSLNRAIHLLRQQQHLEPAFVPLVEVLSSAIAEVEDTAHGLRAYLRRTDLDPQRLAKLDERLAQWMALARRFKRAPEELPGLLTGWQAELQKLDAASDLPALEQAAAAAQSAFTREATTISRQRARTAPKLAAAITAAMQNLGMEGGRFEVALAPRAAPMQDGLEDVHFLVAGHAGSTPRPVGKVASGGELSRIALAIAVTTSELGAAQTLIFDEVDSGVGGSVAQAVGRLMRQLGRDRQVLAVTHLAQVAVCADHHLVVAKRLQRDTTLSSVTAATGEARVSEIARMLGGERILASTLAHARELLQTPP